MKRATPLELLPAEMFSGTYFCEPVRAWFDPIYAAQGLGRWEGQFKPEKPNAGHEASLRSSAKREELIEKGVASAYGTIPMVGTPKHRPPKLSVRRNGKGGRQYGDKVSGFFFRGPSVARTVYAMLTIEGEIPSTLLASRLGMGPSKLKDHLHAAREAGVIVSKPLKAGRVAYAVGAVKPSFA